jgi:hypothetical protein
MDRGPDWGGTFFWPSKTSSGGSRNVFTRMVATIEEVMAMRFTSDEV